MLTKLHIENLALIDRADLLFDKGLTVLSGETGAGKSVIVSALSLALGGRADKDNIRYGESFGMVEAVFDISTMHPDYIKQFDEFIQNKQLVIYRQIKRSGKAVIKISGIPATLNELKDVTAPLAEILGQHANQQLMHEENHLNFLDNFADLSELKNTVRTLYEQWKSSSDELKKIKSKRDTYLKERELLLFQKNEIEKTAITVGESEKLYADKKILDSARALMASASIICEAIDNEENSITQMLSLAQKEIDKMSRVDKELEKQSEDLIDISYRLRDFKSYIEQYGSSIVDDPNRIEEINIRLDEIYNLKKKYGGSEESIIEILQLILQKLSDSPANIDSYIEELEEKTEQIFAEYSKDALSLSDTRKKAAVYLQKLVIKELSELAIENGGFEITFLYEDDPNGVILNDKAVKPTSDGLETARILFSANPGEPLKSLVKTASGGEISRLLLALKSAEKKNKQLSHSLMVFDEVDAGIGGQTAIEVGRKIKKLSSNSQLIVITHLHQIAREADHHFVAQKTNDKDKRTIINVIKLDLVGVKSELKRMVALPK